MTLNTSKSARFLRAKSGPYIGSLMLLAFALSQSDLGTLEVPVGQNVIIDGILAPGEWNRTESLEISVRAGWTVKVVST